MQSEKQDGEKEYDALRIFKINKKKAKDLKFDEKIFNRQLMLAFQVGKKKNEILQMSILHPKLINFR